MNIINKYKKYLIILLIIIISIVLVILKLKLNKYDDNNYDEIINIENVEEVLAKEEVIEEEKVFVDIKGAVANPGVYEIENNKKVIDIINLAGGLRDDADTSLINLARKVEDEMVIVVYTEQEIKEANTSNNIVKPIDTICDCPKITNDACINQNTLSSSDDKSNNNDNDNEENNMVNINSASIEELQTLSGIGESKAQAIIDYREEYGSFKTIEDIKNVSGIGDALYEKIKNNITV